MWLLVLLAVSGAARADTGDTGETGETGVYVDTAAESERVFVQDVGCGGGAALLGLLLLGARRRS